MRVAITGATGLIGAALAERLRNLGNHVTPIIRGPGRAKDPQICWDPVEGTIDMAGLEGHDAVVNLAGESISGLRWTGEKKRRIYESRVNGTTLLASAIAQLRHRPAVLLSGSAFGYYGNRPPAEHLTEASAPGTGFLADVSRAWEASTSAASDAGIRVSHLRFGVVLAAHGGMLHPLLLPFRLGLGGRVGNGRQMMSWIALSDAIDAIVHVLQHSELAGAVNVTSPHPVPNSEFTRQLAHVLHRPAFIPLPSLAVRLALGEMGQELLLGGAAVYPKRLLESGFAFRFPGIHAALHHVLQRNP